MQPTTNVKDAGLGWGLVTLAVCLIVVMVNLTVQSKPRVDTGSPNWREGRGYVTTTHKTVNGVTPVDDMLYTWQDLSTLARSPRWIISPIEDDMLYSLPGRIPLC